MLYTFSDKLLIQSYHTAHALKHEIRARVVAQEKMNWELCGLQAQGAYISLTYKKKR
ncbi:MAG: hypothetical protein ACE5IR_03735 [bacterium]